MHLDPDLDVVLAPMYALDVALALDLDLSRLLAFRIAEYFLSDNA
jgi:hypothetical protein